MRKAVHNIHVATVTYFTPLSVLESFLQSLRIASDNCRNAYPDATVRVSIVDNSPNGKDASRLESLARKYLGAAVAYTVRSGHGNVGYGSALNQALLTDDSALSVVANPDAVLEPDTLSATLEAFERFPDAGILSPSFVEGRQSTHLCKRIPSLAALLLRKIPSGLLPAACRSLLDRYEMHDLDPGQPKWDPPIVTGAFMVFRTDVFKRLGGFDEGYFLYFEDFDISVRAHGSTRLLYAPSVRVSHDGAQSTPWVWWRTPALLRSAWRFWKSHGLWFLSIEEKPRRAGLPAIPGPAAGNLVPSQLATASGDHLTTAFH